MVRDKELEELARPEYWDKRYASERKTSPDGTQQTLDSYEWFRTFENLRPFLAKHLPIPSSGCHILHLGCGNSVTPSPFLNVSPSQMGSQVTDFVYHLADLDSGPSWPWLRKPDKRRLL